MPPAPDPGPAGPALRLAFAADALSVRDGLRRLMSDPIVARLAEDDRSTVELVLAEVLNNVAEHAYFAGFGTVEVTLTPAVDGFGCLIIDYGDAMPGNALPEGRPPWAEGLAPDDLPEGGFGWHLIRSLARDIAYRRDGAENRLGFFVPLRCAPM
jgi:serine/threonine-protein kinase RsbW